MEIINKIKKSKILKLLSNVYLFTSLVFFIWIFFIDSNSVLVNLKLSKELNELKQRKLLLEKQIEIDKQIIANLNNPDSLEKYAREKLYMKKENEKIFIIDFKN
mgnify:FL=1|tara:strand:- start:53 stop:364 length:312 start_codon:yes stop_codon:yes gene_type:complete